jgi:type I restriction enzyme S subunit
MIVTETQGTKPFFNTRIPFDWGIKRLGEILEICSSKRVMEEDWITEGVPFYRTREIICLANKTEFKSPIFISEEFYDELKRKYGVPQPGDILVTGVGTIGETYIVKPSDKFYFKDGNVIWFKVNRLISSEFLSQLFKNQYIRKQLSDNASITTVATFTIDGARNTKVVLPPLPEQKAIAQVLSTADAAIHTTEKLIAQKELRKKWLMQQLLTGKKRLKGFDGEWKEMHLGEMFTERNDTKYFDLPLLSIGQNGVYPQDESIKKDTSNEDKSKYKRICPGDIGYNTMRMWQGRSALSDLEGIVSPAYTVVSPKKNTDSLFFSYLFKMPKMTNLFWRNSQGLVDDTLNCKFKDFSIVKVFLPTTKEEQTAIAQVLQATDKEISLLKAKAERLREQKKGLMQVLLTGKVRLRIN